jgi:DNA-binding NarL/FixJ family response regulator
MIDSRPGVVVVGEAGNGSDAVVIAEREQPDIVLLDLIVAGENGLDYIPKLLAVSKGSRILILTGVNDAEIHRSAVARGAMGLVLKNHTPDTLINAIENVHSGAAWFARTPLSLLAPKTPALEKQQKANDKPPQIDALTRREREVITIVSQGLKNKQIAERLSIGHVTVRHHLTSIFRKLVVSDRFELLIYAYRHGLAAMPNSTESAHESNE